MAPIPGYEDPIKNEYEKNFQENISHRILVVLAALLTGLDEASFTPPRVAQVYLNEDFSHVFGPGHLHGSILGLAVGAIAALPYLIKALFNKTQNNHLKDLLNNLEDEIGLRIDLKNPQERTKLAKFFNDRLKEKGAPPFMEAEIVADKNGDYDLQFHYKPHTLIRKIYIENWKEYKNKTFRDISNKLLPENFLPSGLLANEAAFNTVFFDRIATLAKKIQQGELSNKDHYEQLFTDPKWAEKLLAYAIIYPVFIDENGKISSEDTFEQRRIKALNRLNEYSLAANIYELFNNYSFAFWIAFFGPDMFENQPNATLWSTEMQRGVLSTAFALLAVQVILKFNSFWKNKFKSTDLDKPVNLIIDDTLKHQLLAEYLIEQAGAERLAKAKKTSMLSGVSNSQTYVHIVIDELLNAEDPDAVEILPEDDFRALNKRTQQRIFKKNRNRETEQQISLLQQEAATSRSSFKRVFNGLNTMASIGIQFSFIGWVAGVIASAVGLTLAGAFLLSNPIGLTFVGLGMLAGGIYYGAKLLKQERRAEEKLQASLAERAPKIEKLKKLEAQNRKLESLILAGGKEPLPILPSRDRNIRRLTTTKTNNFTRVRQGAARAAVAVGKMGTGILIVRLIALPIITMAVGAALGLGPIGLGIALGFGLIWAGAHLYHYHKQSKLEAAKRTLENIDTQIKLAEKNQQVLLEQLGHTKRPESAKGNCVKDADSDTSHKDGKTPPTSITAAAPEDNCVKDANSDTLHQDGKTPPTSTTAAAPAKNVLFFKDKRSGRDKLIEHHIGLLKSAVARLEKAIKQSSQEKEHKEEIIYLINELEKLLPADKTLDTRIMRDARETIEKTYEELLNPPQTTDTATPQLKRA